MGVQQIVERFAKQTSVYWGSPSIDGYGGFTFDDPVEISVRWEDSTKVITDNMGKEIVSMARIMLTQDVEEQGYLYLGELTDLTAAQKANPMLIETAFEIKRFDKVPDIKATEFFRECYL